MIIEFFGRMCIVSVVPDRWWWGCLVGGGLFFFFCLGVGLCFGVFWCFCFFGFWFVFVISLG